MSLESAAPPASASSAESKSLDAEEEWALRFLNHCLSSATQVHYLVTSSFTGDGEEDWKTSSLLQPDSQEYMRALLNRYAASTALRARLDTGESLYYLQCLTDEDTRDDFVRVAAAPFFPFASTA
jgi:hypothetical protein